MQFNKGRCQVLHAGRNNLTHRYSQGNDHQKKLCGNTGGPDGQEVDPQIGRALTAGH